jgi:Ca2+-binding EF-hand superfamily protein
MGSKPSRVSLTEQDLETLHNVSQKPRNEILTWFETVKAECPSGKLDKRQFIKHYKCFVSTAHVTLVEEIVEQCFNVFDVDKNGWVDLGEFLMVYVIVNGSDPEEKLKYAFNMYDQDNNGFIDENELRVGLRAMLRFHGLNEGEASIGKIMRYLDENKDGRINKAEFIEGLLSDPYLIKFISPYY